jgi:hypothetical protein
MEESNDSAAASNLWFRNLRGSRMLIRGADRWAGERRCLTLE